MKWAERQKRSDEGGYVAAMTALLLIPMMIFTAFAVDVGAWYAQASAVQTAADAASLAAVPMMPDRDAAYIAALDEANRNGFTHGVDGVNVAVSFPDARSVNTTITVDAEIYFSAVVISSSFDITRASRAEYVLPIPMGSPTNVLGFGSNDGPLRAGDMAAANYWLLEGGPCQPAHHGDVAAAKYNETHSGSWCGNYGTPRSNWKQRSEDRDGGYFFVVDIPAGLPVSSELFIYDPGICGGDGQGKPGENATGAIPLGWRAWNSNGTPLIPGDDFVDTSISPGGNFWTSTDCGGSVATNGGWTKSNMTFPANATADPIRYYVQTKAYGATANNWNHYSFWLRPMGTNASCSTLVTALCPTIAAEEWIPVRAEGTGNGIPMTLYLAEIEPVHAGKTLNVVLWDPGEGMDNIQVIGPDGATLDFTWSSDDLLNHAPVNASDTCSGKPCLWLDPVSNNYPAKTNLPGWGNHWRFNGRTVTLSVPLDAQTDFTSYTNYWFKIRFAPTSTKTAIEWASFSINVTGDPIRLTD